MFPFPESFRPSLERIAAMSDDEFEHLRNVLASAKPSLKIQTLVAEVDEKLNGEIPNIADVLQSVADLNNARVSADLTIEQFIRDVSRLLARRKDKSINLPSVEQRLTSLLNIEALAFSARAFDLQHEYDKLFISARIVSDVRPVFNQAGTEPVATMIVHNLSIKYYQTGEYKEMFIALDEADVAKLRKVLDRADSKVVSLVERFIGKSGIPYLESK